MLWLSMEAPRLFHRGTVRPRRHLDDAFPHDNCPSKRHKVTGRGGRRGVSWPGRRGIALAALAGIGLA